METYAVPLTFPDLDSAKRDAPGLVEALQVAGVQAELVDRAAPEAGDDAGRPDPGPTTRELRVQADGVDDARRRVRTVVEGRFPAGMILLGEPGRA